MTITMPGEREQCKNCQWCGGIFADEENRLWTICDVDRCIDPAKRRCK